MKALKAILFIAAALLLGIGIGIYRIAQVESSEAFFKNGSWRGTNNLPLGKNTLLTTQVTIFALFALPSNEAVYLFASGDSAGMPLNGSNTYRITGNVNNLKAKYWSITAYGKDLFLLPNKADRYSVNNNTVSSDSAGNFSITVAAAEQAANWLPVVNGKPFKLVLRLYGGEASFLKELKTSPLPVILKSTQ